MTTIEKKRFVFTLTRDATESCQVSVVAESIEDARDDALSDPETYRTTEWTADDGNYYKPYIPDPDDFTTHDWKSPAFFWFVLELQRALYALRATTQRTARRCVACGLPAADDVSIRKMSDCVDCPPATCRRCCVTGHGTSPPEPPL